MTLDRALGRGALFIRAPRLAEQQHAQNFAKSASDYVRYDEMFFDGLLLRMHNQVLYPKYEAVARHSLKAALPPSKPAPAEPEAVTALKLLLKQVAISANFSNQSFFSENGPLLSASDMRNMLRKVIEKAQRKDNDAIALLKEVVSYCWERESNPGRTIVSVSFPDLGENAEVEASIDTVGHLISLTQVLQQLNMGAILFPFMTGNSIEFARLISLCTNFSSAICQKLISDLSDIRNKSLSAFANILLAMSEPNTKSTGLISAVTSFESDVLDPNNSLMKKYFSVEILLDELKVLKDFWSLNPFFDRLVKLRKLADSAQKDDAKAFELAAECYKASVLKLMQQHKDAFAYFTKMSPSLKSDSVNESMHEFNMILDHVKTHIASLKPSSTSATNSDNTATSSSLNKFLNGMSPSTLSAFDEAWQKLSENDRLEPLTLNISVKPKSPLNDLAPSTNYSARQSRNGALNLNKPIRQSQRMPLNFGGNTFQEFTLKPSDKIPDTVLQNAFHMSSSSYFLSLNPKSHNTLSSDFPSAASVLDCLLLEGSCKHVATDFAIHLLEDEKLDFSHLWSSNKEVSRLFLDLFCGLMYPERNNIKGFDDKAIAAAIYALNRAVSAALLLDQADGGYRAWKLREDVLAHLLLSIPSLLRRPPQNVIVVDLVEFVAILATADAREFSTDTAQSGAPSPANTSSSAYIPTSTNKSLVSDLPFRVPKSSIRRRLFDFLGIAAFVDFLQLPSTNTNDSIRAAASRVLAHLCGGFNSSSFARGELASRNGLALLTAMAKSGHIPVVRPLQRDRLEIFTDKPLGKGAFSKVFRGRYDGQYEFAIKSIAPGQSQINTSLGQCLQEVSLQSLLRHPNLVSLEGACIDPHKEEFLIALELLDGNMRDVTAGNPLAPMKVVRYADHIARAVRYLHLCGLVHQDIKAENVFINKRDDIVKLGDLGLVGRSNDARGGTPRYQAPEVLAGGVSTPQSDVYSFGLFVWEMYHGEEPFSNMLSIPELKRMVAERHKRPPINKKCPKPLASLIEECWAQSASRRPPLDATIAVLSRTRKALAGIK